MTKPRESTLLTFSSWMAVAALLSFGPSACGERGSSVDPSSDDEYVGEAFGIRLAVHDSREIGRIDEVHAGPNDRFVVVDLGIENLDRSDPVPVASGLLSLRTKALVEFLAAPATGLLPGSCDGAVLVNEGGSHACSVAFALPHAQEVAEIVFRPDTGLELAVAFESKRCTPCGDDCVDLASDRNHCGACFVEIGEQQICDDGEGRCADGLTPCGSVCTNLMTDSSNCGECGRVVPGCVDGEPACPGGDVMCQGVCLDVQYDDFNCGGCGQVCSGNFSCFQGRCWTSIPGSETANCNDVCAAEQLDCRDLYAVYYGSTFCTGGGGGTGQTVNINVPCDQVPPETWEGQVTNSCEFYGSLSTVTCRCYAP